jgi:hemerythrin-like domain-containing protein
MPKPIKRHPAIQPLSREHHQGLLLVFKIRKGLEMEIAPNRIGKYIAWFYQHYLTAHFEAEEKHLFPLLKDDHPMIKKVLEEHEQIRAMIEKADWTETSLYNFKNLLNNHIRFEERELFNHIQEVCSEPQLEAVNKQLEEVDFCLTYQDQFWV